MRKVCSLEMAQLMIEQKEPLTINEIISLVVKRYPNIIVDRSQISSMVRNFVSSRFCTCIAVKDVYPHKYRLLSLDGYTFKIRNDEGLVRDSFPLYVKAGSPRIAREYADKVEKERKVMASQAFLIMGRANNYGSHARYA
ncbi:hypothetical protein [Tatumella sp. OPLPL6]|uniref:hypothetical protein n=1 Tax=Tatumella sp. OPLPL6 TaxID=1928657 RepID=UPI000C19B8ED|nr:hypothetical protein [Tatumella sp. OPLPL6]PIJ43361.1 hypothetical protein BOM24_09355 [Tatumella sp. OPLPL6]